jgi:ProP effector
LNVALRFYTGNRVYLRRIAAGVTRVGLNGEPAGVITEKEAAYARAIERRRLNKLAAKQIAAKSAAPDQTNNKPRRTSLADLKRIALARKAVTTKKTEIAQ